MDEGSRKKKAIRVIATGRTGFEQTLRKDPRVELVRAHTPLDAIGELAGAGDEGDPGDTAILVAPGSLSTEEAEEFAQAVRAIDPRARTVGVGEEFRPLGGSGMFDALVAQDADISILEAALTGKAVSAPSRWAPESPNSPPAALVEPDRDNDDEDEGNGAPVAPLMGPKQVAGGIGLVPPMDDDEEENLRAPSAVPSRPAIAHAPSAARLAPAAAPIPLRAPATPPARVESADADVRVIEVVLAGGDALGTCLAEVRRRLGVEAHFTPAKEPGAPAPAPAEGAPVRRRGAFFGVLRAPGADAGSLERAAEWLAHWLTLNEQVRTLRVAAFTDMLTGAYNRRYFDRYLKRAIDEGRRKRRDVSLLLFDIDNFKSYNDRWGHAAGDEILVETVRLLRSVVRPGDRVCRIGGDEFAVVFSAEPRENHSRHPHSITQLALRFQRQVCEHRFPKLGPEAHGTLTISGGMATFPWEAHDAEALLATADRLALTSKKQGKNVITFGPGAAEVCQSMASLAEPAPAPEAEEDETSDLDIGLPPGV